MQCHDVAFNYTQTWACMPLTWLSTFHCVPSWNGSFIILVVGSCWDATVIATIMRHESIFSTALIEAVEWHGYRVCEYRLGGVEGTQVPMSSGKSKVQVVGPYVIVVSEVNYFDLSRDR
ncbi:hypothetical protein EJ02DRAFT_176714 [Clathrospora elynae]|uniref:Uncharacterized protein n=1 Tax=Clathrospora elynae TaxID=706981 RepID=A0A6A5SUU9_9PLEO|nr:hypothetical protein EJ02DRAFT_176714 [Clathrospora elynae]